MTTLKPVGFFSDLRHGDPGAPALKDSVRPFAQPDEHQAVRYLRGGAVLAASPAVFYDALKPDTALGTAYLLTDGTWVWPSDFAHYVETYHCALPKDFVEHMRARHWQPPASTEIDLKALSPAVREDPGAAGSGPEAD